MRRGILLPIFLFLIFNATSQTTKCACCTENHKAFDFWIGTWEVTNSNGTPAGRNIIEKIQDACILQENWISSNNKFTGTSFNFYNSQTQQWEQLWIDNAGNNLKLKGNRIGNQMILSSDEFEHADGNKYINRITWTLNDDGSVRQLWEVLQDKKVTSVLFDGLYKKVE